MNAKGTDSELAIAAARLDAELRRFEELVTLLTRTAFDSKKGLERAARTLADAIESRDRVATEVGRLVSAVATARDRQQATADRLQARALELQERTAVIASLFERFGALGEDARAMNALLQQASSAYGAAEGERPTAEALARFDDVHARMGDVATKASELAESARQDGVVDIAQQADAIRQQVHATRNRLGLLQRGFSARPSSKSSEPS
jgi:chromosome segregation ATPase